MLEVLDYVLLMYKMTGNPEELTIRGGNPHGSFDQVPLAAREKQRMLFLGSQAGFPEEVAFTLGLTE